MIAYVLPDHGPTAGGTEVMIWGRNFGDLGMLEVTFDGTPAVSVLLISRNKIVCVTPTHGAGKADVKVSNKSGEATLKDGFTFCPPRILWLDYSKEGNGGTCHLSWKLSYPAEIIMIYRGKEELAQLDGTEETYTLEEVNYGYFRYTVALFEKGEMVHAKDVLVEFGKVLWDPPEGDVTGFYLYIAKGPGDPFELLPYEDPGDFSLDVGFVTEVPLLDLLSLGLLDTGTDHHLAASSYLIDGSETLISPLTDPLSFSYEVAIEIPAGTAKTGP